MADMTDEDIDNQLLDARLNAARQKKMAAAPTKEPEKPFLQRALHQARGLVEGPGIGESIPILGPLASKAGHAAAAGFGALTGDDKFGDLYNKLEEEDSKREADYAKEYPAANLTKNLVAPLALPIPNLGMANAVGGAGKLAGLARGALGTADAVVPQMATSYADTALRTGDMDQAAKSAEDTGMLGSAFHLTPQLARYIKGQVLPQGLAGAAEERAFKAATGQNKKAFKDAYMQKAQEMGRDVPEGETVTKVNQIGRDLLTPDESGKPVLGWFDSTKNLAPKLEAKAKDFGKQIGAVGDQVDNLVPQAVSGENIAGRMRDYAETIPNIPSKANLKAQIMKEAEAYSGNGGMNFSDAQKYKNAYQFKPVDSGLNVLPQDVTNAMRGSVGKEMEDTVSKLVSSPETSPEARKQLELYNFLKSKYGSFKTAGKAANDRIMSDLSNRFVSPSDYGMGAVAGLGSMMTGGHGPIAAAAMGAAGAGANKLIRTHGNAFAARGLDALDRLVSSAEGSQFRPILERAAQQGPVALEQAHEMLRRTDANYRKLTEGQP